MDFHDQLDVFLNENKIGTLFTDNGVMSFVYDTEYLNTPGAYPLSKNLPLKEGVFTDPEVEGFFSNLLPDERIRNTVAMILHVSPGNTFRLLIFNFLIGNCDAHAKNYAVLYNNGIPSFAPAYDLLCTMVYETMSRCFAMSVGGENRMGMLKREHFSAMAEECGINPKMVLAELDSMAAKLPDIADKLDRELNAIHPSTVYGSISWQVKHLCLQVAG